VELPVSQEVMVGIGSDDGFKLWVNGKFVDRQNVTRSLGVDTNRCPVKLNKVRNLLLLKILQGGPTGWSLRLTDTKRVPLKTCRVWMS